MEPSDLLRFVVSTLERLGLRYFVTGSTVTIFYGEPPTRASTLGLIDVWRAILDRLRDP
jgi:hypothetical protein